MVVNVGYTLWNELHVDVTDLIYKNLVTDKA